MLEFPEELHACERAALACFWLAVCRERLTTQQLAERLGVTRQSALVLLHKLSRVLPIYQDSGRWHWLDGR